MKNCIEPPPAGRRLKPVFGPEAKTIVPSEPHEIPRAEPSCHGLAQTIAGVPPSRDTVFRPPGPMKASDCPSGDNDGNRPPSVPGIGVDPTRSIERRSRRVEPSLSLTV